MTLSDNRIEPGLSMESDFTIEGGYQAMSRLLDEGAMFTAVFVGNDSMALGALTAPRQRGLHVPDDVSVVGFDGVLESAHLVPGLTTVRQDFQLLGALAVEYIIELIEKPDTPIYQRVLPPKLVIRESTRAVR